MRVVTKTLSAKLLTTLIKSVETYLLKVDRSKLISVNYLSHNDTYISVITHGM